MAWYNIANITCKLSEVLNMQSRTTLSTFCNVDFNLNKQIFRQTFETQREV